MIAIEQILKLFPEHTYCQNEIVLYENKLQVLFYTMESWYASLAGRIILNKEGVIESIVLGRGETVNSLYNNFLLDLGYFTKDRQGFIYNTFSPYKEICGEVKEGKIYLYNKDDYTDYIPKYIKVNIDRELQYMDDKEDLDLFTSLVELLKNRKELTMEYSKTNRDNKLTTHFTFYGLKEDNIRLELWEFFTYNLDICLYINNKFIRLTDSKIENLGAEAITAIILDVLENKENRYATIVEAIDIDYDLQDVRDYIFTKLSDDEYTVKIEYSNHYYSRDPKRPYTYRFDFKNKVVTCIDNTRKSKRIDGIVSIFNRNFLSSFSRS